MIMHRGEIPFKCDHFKFHHKRVKSNIYKLQYSFTIKVVPNESVVLAWPHIDKKIPTCQCLLFNLCVILSSVFII